MTKSSRNDSRRDYRHFPREYTDLLVTFERDGRASLVFSTRREANTARRLLYQFKMLAVSSADADPEDAQARWLVDVFNTCTLRLEPAGTPTLGYADAQADKGATVLILDSNPIVRAMRARVGSATLAEPRAEGSGMDDAQERGSGTDDGPLADAYRSSAPLAYGCRYPAACRSTIHGAPAFCECGDSGAQ